MSRRLPLVVFGTRPEAIKLAPVIAALQRALGQRPTVCFTGQHRDLATAVVEYFQIAVDHNLQVMQPGQSLADLTSRCLQGMDALIAQDQPSCVVVQGDTTTALAGALAAFYRNVPLVHVEAGLRTGDMRRPFPEEFNRRATSLIAELHCAPTAKAAQCLLAEGVAGDRIHITGNTVIDALLQTVDRERNNSTHWQSRYPMLNIDCGVLITCHRRESFGPGLQGICAAITTLASQLPQVQFLWPVHPNPQVQQTLSSSLPPQANVHLLPPLAYPEFVWLMDRCELIISDSGGIQEEAPSLGKPVLVLRDFTERPEAVECGCAEVVGTDKDRIVERALHYLGNLDRAAPTRQMQNPFGDGQAAQRIAQLIAERF